MHAILMKVTHRDQILFLSHAHSGHGENLETCTAPEPPVVHPSNPKSHHQSQDVETATDLRYRDSSKQTDESNADIETALEPVQNQQSRQKYRPSTIDINNPTSKEILLDELGPSRAGPCTLILNLIFRRYTDNDVCKKIFQPLLSVISLLHFLFLFFSFFAHTSYAFISVFGSISKLNKAKTSTKMIQQKIFDCKTE